jgi:hypothetical protein
VISSRAGAHPRRTPLPLLQALRSFDPDGRLINEAVAVQLRALGAEVGACGAAIPGGRQRAMTRNENQFARGGDGRSANAGTAAP